jgi:hypothetical protein
VALDGSFGIGSRLMLTGSTDFDLATNEWGKARAGASLQLARWASVQGEVFQYRPTLDMTTIWGVFGPQSHWGYTGSLRFVPGRAFSLWGSYTLRRYKPEESPSPFGYNLPDSSQEVAAGARIRVGPAQLDGSYRLQLEYGGKQSGGDATLSYVPDQGWRFGLRGTAFQRDGEFRVADGTVYGAGFEARGRLFGRFDIRADVMRFMQRKQERLPATLAGLDWNQTRATIAVDWTFGTNPDRQGGSR